MENIQLAETELDSILDYLETKQHELFGSDVVCIRHRLNAVLNSNSGPDMINTAMMGIEKCLEYWAQTPSHHRELQRSLLTMSDHLKTLWSQRKRQKEALNEAQERIAKRINLFFERFIQIQEVKKPHNGGRYFTTPHNKDNRPRSKRLRKRSKIK